MSFRLRAIGGERSGQTIPLESDLVSFGRDGGNWASFVNDSAMSRHHAHITADPGGLVLVDLASTNGTFVNGVKIGAPYPLTVGDQIRMGSQTFIVELEASTSAPQAPAGRVKRTEVSRYGSRKKETSGAIEPLYRGDGYDPLDHLKGCSLPQIDLSGCVRVLIILLIIMIVAALLFFLVGLVVGFGTMFGAGVGGGAGAGGTGGAAAGGGGNSGGQDQPQQSPPPQESRAEQGIEILDVRIGYDKRGGSLLKPIVLVKWRNATNQPVSRIYGRVRVLDADGKLMVEKLREPIYEGAPIEPGEIHEDTVGSGGILLEKLPMGRPTTAKVNVEKVQ